MQNGLLFYISGEKGPYPDVAQGCAVPNFLRSVEKIDDGVGGGAAIRCLPDQLLTYWAPGNLYSQRGTVSFFWRPRTALGETEFPCSGLLLPTIAVGMHCSCVLITTGMASMRLSPI